MLLNNIALALADKHKTLEFKNGSFLNTVNPEATYNQLGEKLLSEINMFKSSLFPVLKYFKSSLDTAIKSKKPDEGFINHKMFNLPLCLNAILEEGQIQPKTGIYAPITLNKTYQATLDLETEDLKSLFYSDASPASKSLSTILDTMNVEEIRSFLSDYCILFYDNGSDEINPGRKSYRAFGKSGVDAMLHLKELCLLWGFVKKRLLSEDNVSNMARHDEVIALQSALSDIEQLIAIGYGYYQEFEKSGVVAFDDPETAKDTIKYVYVLDANMPELLEKSSQDPYSAIYGSHRFVIDLFDPDSNLTVRTVQNLVENELKYTKYYSDMVKITATRNLEYFIRELKSRIVTIARETYDLYMTDHLKDYSTHKMTGDFTHEVIQYVEKVADEKLTSDSALVSSEIIAGILFDKTYFKMFLNAQHELDDIVDNFDVREDQESTLWVINFLSYFLVDSLEAK